MAPVEVTDVLRDEIRNLRADVRDDFKAIGVQLGEIRADVATLSERMSGLETRGAVQAAVNETVSVSGQKTRRLMKWLFGAAIALATVIITIWDHLAGAP